MMDWGYVRMLASAVAVPSGVTDGDRLRWGGGGGGQDLVF